MKFGFGAALTTVVVVLVGIAMFLLPDYSRPPIASAQTGFRGTGMADIENPRRDAAVTLAAMQAPEIQVPLITEGPKARDVYENVQVLGDLSQAQFTRLMLAITAWVSPEQGCTYCHGNLGFASDELYTKRVSRWMINMTRHINNEWTNHVGEVGVTCYTCHRGNNLPEYVWWEPETTGVEPGSNALLGYYKEFYGPSPEAGLASLAIDPYGPYLEDPEQRIRVVSETALPTDNRASIKQTEWTYALMMHMAQSLGVNCTYCHNSRAFYDWSQSPPTRWTAWYGINMVRDLNVNYVNPLVATLPDYRIGVHGDGPKINCTTCHQGQAKPLNGMRMLDEWPSLEMANVVAREELLPMTLEPMWTQEEAIDVPEAPTAAAVEQADDAADGTPATDDGAAVPTEPVTEGEEAVPGTGDQQGAAPEAAPQGEAPQQDSAAGGTDANVVIVTPEEANAPPADAAPTDAGTAEAPQAETIAPTDAPAPTTGASQ
ncbi:photosynthetic reaction center cytochrome PufC [Acuticoccus sp.]|uniref:photosynthetic reaction center cytochrome PufC n=1 Tax=Acuticoccus sp. TaxID=1904378 RepID=UPI003B51A33E